MACLWSCLVPQLRTYLEPKCNKRNWTPNYLAPRPSDILAVIQGFARVLGQSGGVFKIAFPPEALLRADKIVAYFSSFEAMQHTLSGFAKAKLRAEVQAVPFS